VQVSETEPLADDVAVPADWIRKRVQSCRETNPQFCWRPDPTWHSVCILELGHNGRCGWEHNDGCQTHRIGGRASADKGKFPRRVETGLCPGFEEALKRIDGLEVPDGN
jgi:hypothetical protein